MEEAFLKMQVLNYSSGLPVKYKGIKSNNPERLQQKSDLNQNIQSVKLDAGLLKSYYSFNQASKPFPVSFGRQLSDHLSYGATYLGNNKTKFKVMAPKAQNLYLEVVKKEDIKPVSDLRKGSDSEFYWNYEADPNVKSKIIPMPESKKGIFELETNDVKPGDIYRLIINGKEINGKVEGLKRKDPNSKAVFDVFGWSEVIDDTKLSKTTHNWADNGNLSKLIIDEIHIGLLGGFNKAKKEIDKIAERGIYNAVEIMPIAEFYKDKNWGYDGVDMTAAESSYGTREEFKEFIDYAHKKGLKVILDVVPNHIGPFGNVLDDFGPAFDPVKKTPWGQAINYEGPGNEYMRRYMVDMSLGWLNLGVDGLRFDMTKFVDSDSTLKLINSEIKHHYPEATIIFEDSRNSKRVVTRLTPEEIANPEKGSKGNFDRIGADAQWNFDFQHTLEALATNHEVMGCPPSIYDLEKEFKGRFRWHENSSDEDSPPKASSNIVYHTSHDEVGNRDATRLSLKVMTAKLDMYNRVKNQDWKKANAAIFELTKAFIANVNEKDWTDIQKKYDINKYISKEEFSDVYKQGQSINKLALGTVFVHPGAKMILMGDEEGCLSPFKFFADYPKSSQYQGMPLSEFVSNEKGYPIGQEAFESSKMNQKVYIDHNLKENTVKFSQALAKLYNTNPALNNGKGDWDHLQTFRYDGVKALHVLRKEGNNQILTVMNFSNKEFSDNSPLNEFTLRNLPPGSWEEVLNSDDKEFGGSGKCSNKHNTLHTNNVGEINIRLPKQSIVVFKKKS